MNSHLTPSRPFLMDPTASAVAAPCSHPKTTPPCSPSHGLMRHDSGHAVTASTVTNMMATVPEGRVITTPRLPTQPTLSASSAGCGALAAPQLPSLTTGACAPKRKHKRIRSLQPLAASTGLICPSPWYHNRPSIPAPSPSRTLPSPLKHPFDSAPAPIPRPTPTSFSTSPAEAASSDVPAADHPGCFEKHENRKRPLSAEICGPAGESSSPHSSAPKHSQAGHHIDARDRHDCSVSVSARGRSVSAPEGFAQPYSNSQQRSHTPFPALYSGSLPHDATESLRVLQHQCASVAPHAHVSPVESVFSPPEGSQQQGTTLSPCHAQLEHSPLGAGAPGVTKDPPMIDDAPRCSQDKRCEGGGPHRDTGVAEGAPAVSDGVLRVQPNPYQTLSPVSNPDTAPTNAPSAESHTDAVMGNSALGTDEKTLQEMLTVMQQHPSGPRARLLVVPAAELLHHTRPEGLRLSHVFPCKHWEGCFYAVYD